MSDYADLAVTLIALAGNQNVVTVRKAFVDFTGSLEAGMLLDQLLYWTPRASRKDGFIAKSNKELRDELCLTDYAIRRARKELEELGVLETMVKKWGGAPTVHYRLDLEALNRKWICWIQQIDSLKSTNPFVENNKSLTETTTETESETTDNTVICEICEKSKFTSSEHPYIGEICTCEQEAALEEAFGKRPEREIVQSPAEVIVDGICRYNGLTQGIDALAEKDRASWVRKVAEICERYKVTTEQAKLAWRAYPLRFGFKVQVSPYYPSFESEIAPLLAQARDGDITAESLRREEERGQEKIPRGNGKARKGAMQDDSWNPTQEQIERDKAALLARHRALAGGANA
jgi:hypothetical protein